MQSLETIRQLLSSRGLAPLHQFGQNFLVDQNLLRKLVEAAGVGPGDLVLEVGPGTGTLSEALLERGCRVVMAEIDRGLSELLRETVLAPERPWAGRARLVEGDCLERKRVAPALIEALRNWNGTSVSAPPDDGASVSPDGESGAASAVGAAHATGVRDSAPPFTLVANLPYGAATPLLIDLLVHHPECRGMFVTIQREVGERLLAGPGTEEFGPLAVLAQSVARVRRIAVLAPECFWPRPEVTSVMMGLERAEAKTGDIAGLAEFCRVIFAQRRRQLGSILGRGYAWPPGVEPTMRAEQLSIEQIVALHAARGSATGGG